MLDATLPSMHFGDPWSPGMPVALEKDGRLAWTALGPQVLPGYPKAAGYPSPLSIYLGLAKRS